MISVDLMTALADMPPFALVSLLGNPAMTEMPTKESEEKVEHG
jgi:hypothetical protein